MEIYSAVPVWRAKPPPAPCSASEFYCSHVPEGYRSGTIYSIYLRYLVDRVPMYLQC